MALQPHTPSQEALDRVELPCYTKPQLARLAGLEPEGTDPQHEVAQEGTTGPIVQLCAAASVTDGYEFHQELIAHVRETEEAYNALSKASSGWRMVGRRERTHIGSSALADRRATRPLWPRGAARLRPITGPVAGRHVDEDRARQGIPWRSPSSCHARGSRVGWTECSESQYILATEFDLGGGVR